MPLSVCDSWWCLPSELVTSQHVPVEGCLAILEVGKYGRHENTVQTAAGHHTAKSINQENYTNSSWMLLYTLYSK